MLQASGRGEPSRAAVPSRQQLRASLAAYWRPSTALALAWVSFDVCIFVALSALIVLPLALPWKIVASLALGLWFARLFVLGHDACHQALTPYRALNRVIGRIVFLPTLTPYSAWEFGHNLTHHGYSNLRGRDSVWAPLSAKEYLALPSHRRWLERAYRCGWAPGLYYLIEQWWRIIFPWATPAAGYRKVFAKDRWLVTVFGVCWVAALGYAASLAGSPVVEAVALGWLIPFLIWNTLIGFVTYIHHTEPGVHWYDDGAAWAASHPYLSTTLHVHFPALDWLSHRILQHPAHHLDMTIPFYCLGKVQRRLAELAPSHVHRQIFTWSYYWNVARTCKVYDYAARTWSPFPTAIDASSKHAANVDA